MVVLADENKKVVFVVPHKCGISTISTYVSKSNGIECSDEYNVSTLRDLGFTEYKPEYLNYHKILVLRDPYERFISGFLQDVSYNNMTNYKNIDLTFEQFCDYLQKVYMISNVNYYVKNGIKILFYDELNILALHYNDNNCKNLLSGHIGSMYREIYTDLQFFNNTFDEIITINELDSVLKKIYCDNGENVKHVNVKKKNIFYGDIRKMSVCDIATLKYYPQYEHFYTEHIKDIVTEMYSEDFKLFEMFGISNKIKNITIKKLVETNRRNCMIIVPNCDNLNITSMSNFILNIPKQSMYDIYVIVSSFYCNKFGEIAEIAGIHLIGKNDMNINVFNKNILQYHLDVLTQNDRCYEKVLLYNDMPVFIDNMIFNQHMIDLMMYPTSHIEQINFNDDKWFNTEIKKDIDIIGYTNIYRLSYNGILIDATIVTKCLEEMLEICDGTTGLYPPMEVILPTLLHNKYKYDVIHNVDKTVWTHEEYTQCGSITKKY
jgi:hypothetical protein